MDQPAHNRNFSWRTAIITAAILILAVIACLMVWRTGRGMKNTVDRSLDVAVKAVEKLPEVAERFRTGRITHTFRESLPEIHSTGGDVLELAVVRSDETFQRSDEKRIGWDYISLGTTVAEIRVPVTFRYHVRLSDPWRLATRGQVCLVLAPRIRPSLPPAIHTDGMEKRAESGWARFDGNEQLAELEKSLTPMLNQRGGDAAHINLVREACRRSVAEFVRKWLLREEQWSKDRFTAVIVVFPDEISAGSDEDLLKLEREPVLTLVPE